MAASERQAVGLTVETVLWIGILSLGALMRFGALGRWPLSTHEALVALAAAGEAVPVSVAPPLTIGPLAYNLVALGAWLFGASDVAVRVFPALAGLLLVALPLLARHLIGRGPALGASLFIALSPSLSFSARRVGDTSVSAVCALWMAGALAHYTSHPSSRSRWHVLIAFAVGVTSGAGFWGLIVTGLLYLALLRWQQIRSQGETQTWTTVIGWLRELTPYRPRTLGALLAVILFVSTAAFTHPGGLGQMLAQPARWLALVFGRGEGLVVPFSLTLLLYEAPLLLWAALGATLWYDDHPHLTNVLLLWSGVVLVPATITNSGWAGGVAHAVLPLTILAGVGLARVAGIVARTARHDVEGYYGGLALVALAFIWLNLLSYSFQGTSSRLWLAIGGLILVGALFVLMAVWVHLSAALRTAGAVVAVASLFLLLHTAWQLNYHHGADPREPLVVAPSDPDLRYVARFLRPVSENRAGYPGQLPIAVQTNLGPAPLWYLRAYRDVSRTAGSHPDQPVAVLLEAEEPAPAGWIGQRVRLGRTWTWPGLAGPALTRWLLFREAPGVEPTEAVLYFEVP